MILLTRHKEENLFIKKKLLTENINSISEPITHIRHLSKNYKQKIKKFFSWKSANIKNNKTQKKPRVFE